MASAVMGLVINQSTLAFSVSSGSARFTSQLHLRERKESGRRSEQRRRWAAIRAEVMATEKLGVKVQKNPPEEKLAELGIRSWPKWGCPPSKFPWEYTSKETCYLLQGKVKVYPDGHSKEYVEIEAGDLVEFPKGMKCTWDVSVAVDKHYNFE